MSLSYALKVKPVSSKKILLLSVLVLGILVAICFALLPTNLSDNIKRYHILKTDLLSSQFINVQRHAIRRIVNNVMVNHEI